jgi:hypothetical protein
MPTDPRAFKILFAAWVMAFGLAVGLAVVLLVQVPSAYRNGFVDGYHKGYDRGCHVEASLAVRGWPDRKNIVDCDGWVVIEDDHP